MFESKHRIQENVDNTEHEQKIHIIVLENIPVRMVFFNVSEQFILVLMNKFVLSEVLHF